MKQILIFALITLSINLLTSCSGNTTASAGKESVSGTSDISDLRGRAMTCIMN
jgi:predicted small secreted protein